MVKKQPTKAEKVHRTIEKVDNLLNKVLAPTDWLGRKK